MRCCCCSAARTERKKEKKKENVKRKVVCDIKNTTTITARASERAGKLQDIVKAVLEREREIDRKRERANSERELLEKR